jgi:hypothetical protein
MSDSPVFHHAFKRDYPNLVRELTTPINVAGPSLLNEFDHSKKIITFERGIWDTGATNTVISPKVVQALELSPIGMMEVYGVNSKTNVKTYMVDIILPNNVLIKNLTVSESEIAGTDVLIGMDIIQAGDFSIANAGGKTKFTFCIPSHPNPVCLLEKSQKVNERNQKKR